MKTSTCPLHRCRCCCRCCCRSRCCSAAAADPASEARATATANATENAGAHHLDSRRIDARRRVDDRRSDAGRVRVDHPSFLRRRPLPDADWSHAHCPTASYCDSSVARCASSTSPDLRSTAGLNARAFARLFAVARPFTAGTQAMSCSAPSSAAANTNMKVYTDSAALIYSIS
jgi:hypothetical protein